jgi:putative transposase
MIEAHNKIYLFIHTIWSVHTRKPLLKKPVRMVLFPHMQKHAEENGTNIVTVNGVEDHVHCLIRMHPTQNLAQIVKGIKGESSQWLNDNKLLTEEFGWQDGYAAYSVSPSGVKQVTDYIYKQEEHHKTKTLEGELEVFDTIQF